MTSKEVKETLKPWVADILRTAGRRLSIVEIARDIWRIHEPELRQDETLFYTWQYEMRWAADTLKEEGKLEKSRRLDVAVKCHEAFEADWTVVGAAPSPEARRVSAAGQRPTAPRAGAPSRDALRSRATAKRKDKVQTSGVAAPTRGRALPSVSANGRGRRLSALTALPCGNRQRSGHHATGHHTAATILQAG